MHCDSKLIFIKKNYTEKSSHQRGQGSEERYTARDPGRTQSIYEMCHASYHLDYQGAETVATASMVAAHLIHLRAEATLIAEEVRIFAVGTHSIGDWRTTGIVEVRLSK